MLKNCFGMGYLLGVAFFFAVGCKTPQKLTPVDYSMLLETVLTPESSGWVADRGYGVGFNVKPVHFMETGDSSSVASDFRFIRDVDGFYYLTAAGYRNVYIFKPGPSNLTLHKKVFIKAEGLQKPAFNQRKPVIQLIDGDSQVYVLNKEGLSGVQ